MSRKVSVESGREEEVIPDTENQNLREKLRTQKLSQI